MHRAVDIFVSTSYFELSNFEQFIICRHHNSYLKVLKVNNEELKFNKILKIFKKSVWSVSTNDITKRMTYENVENCIRKNGQKLKIDSTPNCRKLFWIVLSKCQCVFNTRRLFCVKNDKEKNLYINVTTKVTVLNT